MSLWSCSMMSVLQLTWCQHRCVVWCGMKKGQLLLAEKMKTTCVSGMLPCRHHRGTVRPTEWALPQRWWLVCYWNNTRLQSRPWIGVPSIMGCQIEPSSYGTPTMEPCWTRLIQVHRCVLFCGASTSRSCVLALMGSQRISWFFGSGSGSSLTKVKELTSHISHVLSLACSPDRSTVFRQQVMNRFIFGICLELHPATGHQCCLVWASWPLECHSGGLKILCTECHPGGLKILCTVCT
jgi:hypothetical protein